MLHKIWKRNCKAIEPLLWEYAGGRLSSEQRARVKAHLAHCSSCQAQLQTVTQIGQELKTLRQSPVPATQTGWMEVQARLIAAPLLSQPAAPARSAGRLRILAGAGMAATVALLWAALAPRGVQQSLSIAKEGAGRPTKPNTFAAATNLTDSISKMEARIATSKPVWPENALINKSSNEDYGTRSIAPTARWSTAAFRDAGTLHNRFVTTLRNRSFVRRNGFARKQHGLLLASLAVGRQQNANAGNAASTMLAPVGYALSPVATNYVLTDVAEGETRRSPRAYVMDCVPSGNGSQTKEEFNPNGDERVW